MNWTLFRATVKSNWIIALFVTLFILIYVATSIGMFDPVSADAMTAMLEVLPDGMLKAFGFANLGTDLTQYISNYLFGFIMIIFPLIYCIIIANRVVAKHVDTGAMAYVLTTPNSRAQVAITQAVYLAASLAVILIIDTGVAVLMSVSMFPGLLDVPTFLILSVINYLAMLVVAGVGFLSSCIFSETRYSLALGAGVPALFFISRMVSNFGEEVEWFRYLSVFSLVDIERILARDGYAATPILALVPMALVLFGAGVFVFDRKSLSL